MPNAIGTNEIGLSFSSELDAAGLLGLPFSWDSQGNFHWGPSMTGANETAVLAVYAAHNPNTSNLIIYANQSQWALATGGFTVTLNGAPHTFNTDSESYTLMTAKQLEAKNNSPPPFMLYWQFNPTDIQQISSDDYIASAQKVARFTQKTFDTLAVALAEINAGTITTTAQIDALFNAIPNYG